MAASAGAMRRVLVLHGYVSSVIFIQAFVLIVFGVDRDIDIRKMQRSLANVSVLPNTLTSLLLCSFCGPGIIKIGALRKESKNIEYGAYILLRRPFQ